MNRIMNRTIAAAGAVAIVLGGMNAPPAAAAQPNAKPAAIDRIGLSAYDTTEFSGAKRRARRAVRRNDRAAMQAFFGIAGTIAAIAAAERYRRDYYRYGYHPYYGPPPYPYYGPHYYYPPPYYYSRPRYYPYW
jgi:hypothetical protein